jgi:hypothetical protein
MWQRLIDGQYRRPTGLLGRIIGAKTMRDHLLALAGFQHTFIHTDSNPVYRSNYCVVGIK